MNVSSCRWPSDEFNCGRRVVSCLGEWGFIYPVNYGFVPGQPAPDGEDLDAYVPGVFEPLRDFTGRCIAVVHRADDDDDKLVLVPEGVEYMVEFQERFFESTVCTSNAVDEVTG